VKPRELTVEILGIFLLGTACCCHRISRCVESNNIFSSTPLEYQHRIWHSRIPWS